MFTQRASRLLRRPSHGAVVAYLALFLALTTGGAWAAAQIGPDDIGKNAVRSRHIKDGQVRAKDVRNGAVTPAKLAANAVTGDKVQDGSLSGADLADGAVSSTELAPDAVTKEKVLDDSLTGSDIDESSLGQVPDASRLAGRPASSFIGSSIYKAESAVGPGNQLGDGTFVLAQSCNPGDILLSGGPANIAATSTLLESFPSPGTTSSWSTRINKNGQTDNFSVVVLCADQ
jgi:hypothetical protein